MPYTAPLGADCESFDPHAYWRYLPPVSRGPEGLRTTPQGGRILAGIGMMLAHVCPVAAPSRSMWCAAVRGQQYCTAAHVALAPHDPDGVATVPAPHGLRSQLAALFGWAEMALQHTQDRLTQQQQQRQQHQPPLEQGLPSSPAPPYTHALSIEARIASAWEGLDMEAAATKPKCTVQAHAPFGPVGTSSATHDVRFTRTHSTWRPTCLEWLGILGYLLGIPLLLISGVLIDWGPGDVGLIVFVVSFCLQAVGSLCLCASEVRGKRMRSAERIRSAQFCEAESCAIA